MKLDGYRPTDEQAAEQGVWKRYSFPAPYGPNGGRAVLKAKIRWAGSASVGYQNAISRIVQDTEDDDPERPGLLSAALYEHCILEWSTTLQSGDKDLEPTRENFIGLMAMDVPEIAQRMSQVYADIHDRQVFVRKRRADAEKN